MKFNKDLKKFCAAFVCVFFSNILTVEEAFQFANTTLNKETKKHEAVSVVSLMKVVRSLYTNTVLFQDQFKDYHFLNYTHANWCN